MTRHLVRSTTSLAFYKAMKARGKTAEETSKIIVPFLSPALTAFRGRLIERPNARLHRKLTPTGSIGLIFAPAGFGKTTLLSE